MLGFNLLQRPTVVPAMPMFVPQAQLPFFSQAAYGNQASRLNLVSAAQTGFSRFAGGMFAGGLPLAQTSSADYAEPALEGPYAVLFLGVFALGLAGLGIDMTWKSLVEKRLLAGLPVANAPENLILKQLLNDIKYQQPSPLLHPVKHHSWVRDMQARVLSRVVYEGDGITF